MIRTISSRIVALFMVVFASLFLITTTFTVMAAPESPTQDCRSGYTQIPGWSTGFCWNEDGFTADLTAVSGEVLVTGPSTNQVDLWIDPTLGYADGYAFYEGQGSGMSDCVRTGKLMRQTLPNNGLWGIGPCDPPLELTYLPLICSGCTANTPPPPPTGESPSDLLIEFEPNWVILYPGMITASVGSGDVPLTYTLELPGEEPLVLVSDELTETFQVTPMVDGPLTATLTVANEYGLEQVQEIGFIGYCPAGLSRLHSQIDGDWSWVCGSTELTNAASGYPIGQFGFSEPTTASVWINPQPAAAPFGGYAYATTANTPSYVLDPGLGTYVFDPGPTASLGIWSFAFSDGSPVPPAYVEIEGPNGGQVGETIDFNATVAPFNTTTPVSVTIVATDLTATMFVTESLEIPFSFSWSAPGTKWITVTAESNGVTVQDTHWVDVGAPPNNLAFWMSDQCLLLHSCYLMANVEGSWPLTYTLSLPDQGPYVVSTNSLTETFEFTPTVSGDYTATVRIENQYGSIEATQVFFVNACPTWLGVSQTYSGPNAWYGFCGDVAFNQAAEDAGVVGELELTASSTMTFWVNPMIYTNGGTFWSLTPGNPNNVGVSPGLNASFFDIQGISPSRWGFAASSP